MNTKKHSQTRKFNSLELSSFTLTLFTMPVLSLKDLDTLQIINHSNWQRMSCDDKKTGKCIKHYAG
jgi:hypothetical protein